MIQYITVVHKLDVDNFGDRIRLKDLKDSFVQGQVSAIMMGDAVTQLDQIRDLIDSDSIIDSDDIIKIIGN